MKKPEITPLAVLNAHNPWLREGRKKAKNHRPKILSPQSAASKKFIKKGLNWPVLRDMYGNDKDGNDNRRYIVEATQ
jgi:hypothetical protein